MDMLYHPPHTRHLTIFITHNAGSYIVRIGYHPALPAHLQARVSRLMSNTIPKTCFVRPRPKQSLTASLSDVVTALKQPSQEKQETNSQGHEEATAVDANGSGRPNVGTNDIDDAVDGTTDTDKKEAMLPPPPPMPSKAKINAPPHKAPAKKTSDENADNASTSAVVHGGQGTHLLKGILKKSGDNSGPEDDESSALVPAGGGAYDPLAAVPTPRLPPGPVMTEDGTWVFPMANDGMNGTFLYKHQLILTPSAPPAANAVEAAPEPESEPAKAKEEPACIVCKGTEHIRDFSKSFGFEKAWMCYACFQHNTGAEQELFWFNGAAIQG